MFPFFEVEATGFPGAAIVLTTAVAATWITWGACKLKQTAWWGDVLFLLVIGVSNLITFSVMDLMELYERMVLPEQQLEMMRRMV